MTLPLGRAKPWISPSSTGFLLWAITMGTVRVISLVIRAIRFVTVTIASTFKASSCAIISSRHSIFSFADDGSLRKKEMRLRYQLSTLIACIRRKQFEGSQWTFRKSSTTDTNRSGLSMCMA